LANNANLVPGGDKGGMQDKSLLVGWREWLALPALGVPKIKAKIDTGARTSALHAFEVDSYVSAGQQRVRFRIHPRQKDQETIIECDEVVLDKRWVTDSGGHREERFVIVTWLQISVRQRWPIELTLTSRDNMKFRMLLGRTAMRGRMLVSPGESYLLDKPGVRWE
jgi:hypothetical protein